jgi:DNA-binding CsgD family transcriptional regulator
MYPKTATIQLTIDQIATALGQLSPKEFEILEELLDKKTTQEVLRRAKDTHADFVSHEEMLKNFV